VPESDPIARSAFIGRATISQIRQGWEMPADRATGPLKIDDLSAVAKVLVKAPATPEVDEAVGSRFGRAAWYGERLVCGAAPDEWLIMAPVGTAAQTVEHFRAAVTAVTRQLTTVMDLTHGRALLRIRGANTLRLLHRLTAIDLDDRFVPQGAALRTSVARVVTDVVRDDVADEPSYLLHCERSSGRYLLESLLAAGSDLDAYIDGGPSWPDHAPQRHDVTGESHRGAPHS